MPTFRFRAGLVLLLAVLFVLGLIPPLVLGAAIGWPASLGFPAERILPLIHTHLGEVRLGYGAYLAYSSLFLVLIACVAAWGARGRPWGLPEYLAVGFAAVSSLARDVGILRWLTAVPGLAETFATSPDAATVLVFNAVDSYGGAIGEALGIGLFGGTALAALGLGFVSGGRRWLGWVTLAVAAVQLLNVAGLFGADLGPATTFAAVSLLAWFVVLGVSVVRRG